MNSSTLLGSTMGQLGAFPWPSKHAPMSDVVNGTATDCHNENHIAFLLYITVIVTAFTIVILLGFTQRRREHCRHILWGIPGIIVPIKFLSASPFRFIYCLIMSAWGGDVLQNMLDKGLYFHSDGGLEDTFDFFVATPTVIILSQAVAYFPVFACVDAPIPLLGHVIGFFYTLLLAGSNIYTEALTIRGCSYRGVLTNKDIGISLGVVCPVYVFYVVIAGWFFSHAAMETMLILFRRHNLSQNIPDCDEYQGDFRHVKSLLKRPIKLTERGGNFESLWNYFLQGLKFVTPYNPKFRYPLPFLGALIIAYTMLYQLIVSWTGHLVIYSNNLIDFIDSFNVTVKWIETLFPESKPEVDKIYSDVQSFGKAMQTILPVGIVIGFLNLFLFTVYMVQSFHKQLRRASRGDISFLVSSEPLPTLTYMLAGTMKYSAFQAAYLLATWMLYTLMLWSIMFVGLCFYYLFKNFQSFGIHIWSWFMLPMMWAAGLHHLQLFICRYFFLDKKSGQFVTIQHRRLYQVVTYILFFFNMIFGMVMCVLRVFAVIIFTMVMLFRIDWDVYMRGLEGWDTGNRTYISYVYMECTFNNSVLRTFTKLLQDTVKGRTRRVGGGGELLQSTSIQRDPQRAGSASSEENEASSLLHSDHSHLGRVVNGGPLLPGTLSTNSPSLKSRRARNRWLVAYTLLRNPGLQELTASRIEKRAHIQCDEHLDTTFGQTDYGTTYVHK